MMDMGIDGVVQEKGLIKASYVCSSNEESNCC